MLFRMEASKEGNIYGCVSDSVDVQSAVIGITGMACHFPGQFY